MDAKQPVLLYKILIFRKLWQFYYINDQLCIQTVFIFFRPDTSFRSFQMQNRMIETLGAKIIENFGKSKPPTRGPPHKAPRRKPPRRPRVLLCLGQIVWPLLYNNIFVIVLINHDVLLCLRNTGPISLLESIPDSAAACIKLCTVCNMFKIQVVWMFAQKTTFARRQLFQLCSTS